MVPENRAHLGIPIGLLGGNYNIRNAEIFSQPTHENVAQQTRSFALPLESILNSYAVPAFITFHYGYPSIMQSETAYFVGLTNREHLGSVMSPVGIMLPLGQATYAGGFPHEGFRWPPVISQIPSSESTLPGSRNVEAQHASLPVPGIVNVQPTQQFFAAIGSYGMPHAANILLGACNICELSKTFPRRVKPIDLNDFKRRLVYVDKELGNALCTARAGVHGNRNNSPCCIMCGRKISNKLYMRKHLEIKHFIFINRFSKSECRRAQYQKALADSVSGILTKTYKNIVRNAKCATFAAENYNRIISARGRQVNRMSQNLGLFITVDHITRQSSHAVFRHRCRQISASYLRIPEGSVVNILNYEHILRTKPVPLFVRFTEVLCRLASINMQLFEFEASVCIEHDLNRM